MFRKLKANRSQNLIEKLNAKGKPQEIFRIYGSSQLGTKDTRFMGEWVFFDQAIAFLLIKKFHLLTYTHPAIASMYVLTVLILGDIFFPIGWWASGIAGGIGAVLAGVVHDFLRKRRAKKINTEIGTIVTGGQKAHMEAIFTFFWRENVKGLKIDNKSLFVEWGDSRTLEIKLHRKRDLDLLQERISDYPALDQEENPPHEG